LANMSFFRLLSSNELLEGTRLMITNKVMPKHARIIAGRIWWGRRGMGMEGETMVRMGA
jgi:hypothetical protein